MPFNIKILLVCFLKEKLGSCLNKLDNKLLQLIWLQKGNMYIIPLLPRKFN